MFIFLTRSVSFRRLPPTLPRALPIGERPPSPPPLPTGSELPFPPPEESSSGCSGGFVPPKSGLRPPAEPGYLVEVEFGGYPVVFVDEPVYQSVELIPHPVNDFAEETFYGRWLHS